MSIPCFEPTYKELKQEMERQKEMIGMFVLSLPIRNWNRCRLAPQGATHAGFEPTYKELKHEFTFNSNQPPSTFWAYL